MLSKAFYIISILGIIWLTTGLVISSVRHRRLGVNLPKLVLCVSIVLFAFMASIVATLNGW